MHSRVHRDLTELLADEHAALLAGKLDDIIRITNEKERLLERLSEESLSAGALGEMAADIMRNQALLAAAIRGVQAAQHSISDAKRGKAEMTVYGADGQVSRLRTPGKRLSRKI